MSSINHKLHAIILDSTQPQTQAVDYGH